MKIKHLFLMLIVMISITACQLLPRSSNSEALPKLSIQLWSVREPLKADFKGTLTKLANLGFEGVEFAQDFGPYKNDPKGLKTFLNSIGLQSVSAHTHVRKLQGNNFQKAVDFYQAIGVKILIIASDKRADDADKIDDLVADLNTLHAKLKKEGILLGYHNHARELGAMNSQITFWDRIAQNTPQDFVMQLDVGHAEYAGAPPAHYIRKYPNRTIVTHLKARIPEGIAGKLAIIGSDVTDWKSVLNATITVGGTQWWILEQDNAIKGHSQLETMTLSKQGLEKIVKQL